MVLRGDGWTVNGSEPCERPCGPSLARRANKIPLRRSLAVSVETCDTHAAASPFPRRSSPMPPTTSRDFQQAAGQRFTGAEALQRARLDLDAQYLGGYTSSVH